MRSHRWLLAIALLVALAASACGDDSGDETAGGTSATGAALSIETISDGRLTACTDAPYPPFELEENGEFTGFDMEILRAIGQNLDLELAVTVQPFDGIWLAPASGRCDIVGSAMTITPERAANALFSDPYFDADQSLLVRAEDEDVYAELEDLADRTIGVQSGTTGALYAQENAPEGATIRDFDEPAALFPALLSGQIDAVLQDFPVNLERARTADDVFAPPVRFETGEQYGFAVAEDNTALKEAVDAELAVLRNDGTYDEIFAQFFPEG